MVKAYFNYEHPSVQQLLGELKGETTKQKDWAIKAYYKVRDGWRYNPYRISLVKAHYAASELIKSSEGHCIDKSIILITLLRGMGIPARLHLAAVRNHIGVERLVERFGTNLMTPHGMVDIFLNKQWIKVSPAFNKTLCEKCNVEPLEFDGQHDSIFQEFDKAGGQFMDYVKDYGSFEDVPLDFIKANMKEHYGHLAGKLNKDGVFNL